MDPYTPYSISLYYDSSNLSVACVTLSFVTEEQNVCKTFGEVTIVWFE